MNDQITTLLTQCPHCDTVFRVSGEQLGVAQGRVRCGQCRGVFDAHAHPYEQPDIPVAASVETPEPEDWEEEADDTPYLTASRDDDDWMPAAPFGPEAGESPPVPVDDSGQSHVSVVVTPRPEPVLRVDVEDVLRVQLTEQVHAVPVRRQTLRWSLLALLLLATLGIQYVYFTRATLAQYEPMRPWLQRACGYVGCNLPLRHVPGRIELLSRDVISHPRVRAALLINATFVNRADFVQAYPVLQIALSNDGGTVAAMRRFQPEEYLAPSVVIAAGLAPGVPVHVVLEVVEPRQHASSFQFDFL